MIMGNFLNAKISLRVFALSALLAAAACSNDGRPFLEAVEAEDLQLKSIQIVQPTGLLPDLVVNTNARVSFNIEAKNTDDNDISLSPDNRRWSVDKPELASIDERGNFVATGTGRVVVRLQISGLLSEFPVSIQDETFQMISSIEGPATMERCIPGEYFAKGMFSLGSERGLPNVEWSIVDTEFGSVGEAVDGRVMVNGTNVGALSLVATLDGQTFTQSITIEDTLQAIVIEPDNLVVQNGGTLQLTAYGQYFKDGVDEVARLPDITENVVWSITGRDGVATISNASPNEGRVSTSSVNNTQVTAACGNLEEPKALVVVARGATDNTSLAFDVGSPYEISLSAGDTQLNVSTGSTYNRLEQVTINDDTTWSVVEGGSVVSVNNTTAKGVLTPLRVGNATVQVEYKGRVGTIDIEVTN